MSATNLGVITREEWVRRYAARIVERAGWTQQEADDAAFTGADEFARYEMKAQGFVVWWGGPSKCDNTPEDAADEEMSYWTDDEGSAT